MSDSTAASSAPSQGRNGVARAEFTTHIREALTFLVGAEEYAIDILRVQEIRSYEVPTRIANAASEIRGVINLRGVIVPILDIRTTLGLQRSECDGSAATIIVNVSSELVGVVVDSVTDVIRFEQAQLKPIPELSCCTTNEYILAIGVVGARTLILLDIQGLIARSDLGLAADTAH